MRARLDRLLARIDGAHVRHPRASTVGFGLAAFAVRLALAPLSVPLGTDAFFYLVKAREIAGGNLAPTLSHAIGWPIVLAPFVAAAPGGVATEIPVVLGVAALTGAVTVVPLARIARRVLEPRAQWLALLAFVFCLPHVEVTAGLTGGLSESLTTLLFVTAVAGALDARERAAARAMTGIAAGLACWAHATGPLVALAVLAVWLGCADGRPDARGMAAVAGLMLAVAAPALVQRWVEFGGPFAYGANSRLLAVEEPIVWARNVPHPSLLEFVRAAGPAGLVDHFVVRGVVPALGKMLWYVITPPLIPLVAIAVWRRWRDARLRALALAVAVVVAAWTPLWPGFGASRHLAPTGPFVWLLAAVGLVEITAYRRARGLWHVVAAVALVVGYGAAGVVMRRDAAQGPYLDGVEWARWTAAHVRGRLALPFGQELIMMHLPDAAAARTEVSDMYAPRSGLALTGSGWFASLDEAMPWYRQHAVTHLALDGLSRQPPYVRGLETAAALPPYLLTVYSNHGGPNQWPMRIVRIDWARYDGVAGPAAAP